MARRLMRGGHECVVYDRNPENVRALVREGARGCLALEELARLLVRPRAVWVMVPAGEPTEEAIAALAEALEPGDTIVDGGNTYFKDDVRRARNLAAKELDYIDVGTSGGVWGLERGYCLMIGGPAAPVDRLRPIFEALAPGRGSMGRTPRRQAANSTAEEGYLHCGPVGSGHFVKMVHNGIEYGLMQAYAEGFDIMRNAASSNLPEPMRYNLDLAEVAEVWRRGSVVSSWLLDLTAAALTEDPFLSRYSGSVQDSGEGRWTVLAAIEESVPVNALSSALFARFRSRQENTFGERLLSAMRFQFGGHVEKPHDEHS